MVDTDRVSLPPGDDTLGILKKVHKRRQRWWNTEVDGDSTQAHGCEDIVVNYFCRTYRNRNNAVTHKRYFPDDHIRYAPKVEALQVKAFNRRAMI